MGSFLVLLCIPLILNITNASIEKINNPILPINLLSTRIITSKHTFVSYLNVTDFVNIKNDLKLQLHFVQTKKNLGNHTLNLIEQANILLSYIDNSLRMFHSNKRSKRGLINIGGKFSKWLFGTLDDEDGKRINSILSHLDKNDHLLQERINEQISLSKEIITKTNISLSKIKSNLISVNKLINKFSERINEINTLELIINSLLILQIQLNQITNAVTFANLNRVHPNFLPLDILTSLIKKMNTSYPRNQLVHFKNSQSYYSFLGIQQIFKDNKIIFLIHFPILMAANFKTYFVYPIPINNKIILPQKPFLVLNERNDLYEYQEEPCKEIEDTYYCRNHLQTEEDCVVNIIKENIANNCSSIPVHLKRAIANQVTPHHVLLSTPKQISVTEKGSTEVHHELSPGSYLINMPSNCHLYINQEVFTSENEDIPSAVIVQLPYLNLSLIPERAKKIQLSNLNLEEIQQLTTKVNNQHEINILKDPLLSEDKLIPVWTHALIYLAIIVVIFLGVTCYYRSCYPYPYPLRRRKTRNEEEENGIALASQSSP